MTTTTVTTVTTTTTDGPVARPVSKADLEPGAATCQVVKMVDERRYTLGVAWPAMKANVVVAADGCKDFMSADEVEKTAWDWMTNSRSVGIGHQAGSGGSGTVVESYIYRGPDWTITAADGSTQVVKAGDWLLGTVWSETAWSMVKKGQVGGYSPQGVTRRIKPTADRLAELRS